MFFGQYKSKPICCRCNKEANFDKPLLFCPEHWARFWGGFDTDFAYAPVCEETYKRALIAATKKKTKNVQKRKS